MPGDPLRAKFIAETYLENAKLVNKVRGMLAYTGTYRGTLVTVMASGMGIPSMGIYSYRYFHDYDVEENHSHRNDGSLKRVACFKRCYLVDTSITDSTFAKSFFRRRRDDRKGKYGSKRKNYGNCYFSFDACRRETSIVMKHFTK